MDFFLSKRRSFFISQAKKWQLFTTLFIQAFNLPEQKCSEFQYAIQQIQPGLKSLKPFTLQTGPAFDYSDI